jgi:transcription antitermination factor NusG
VKDTLWNAVYVRPSFERIVSLHLGKQRLEHFLPIQQSTVHSHPQTKKVERPLFPGYLFCRCSAAERRSMYAIPGVLSVLSCTASVEADEIEALYRVVHFGLKYEPRPSIPRGVSVTVEDGLLRGVSGVMSPTANKKRFLIIPIELIARLVAVEIEQGWTLSVHGRYSA